MLYTTVYGNQGFSNAAFSGIKLQPTAADPYDPILNLWSAKPNGLRGLFASDL